MESSEFIVSVPPRTAVHSLCHSYNPKVSLALRIIKYNFLRTLQYARISLGFCNFCNFYRAASLGTFTTSQRHTCPCTFMGRPSKLDLREIQRKRVPK